MASRQTRALLVFVAALGAAVACNGGSNAPAISGFTPSTAKKTQAVTIQISGRNFYRKIVPDAANASNSTANDLSVTFAQGAQSFTLLAGTSSTPSQISVDFPAGEMPGPYSVTVHADGGDATLDSGFTVLAATNVKVSSGVEAVPGTADTITLSIGSFDDAGVPEPVSSNVSFAIQLLGAGSAASATPSSVVMPAGQSTVSFDVTDIRVESFAVGATPSIALGVSSGTVSFIAGPPARVHGLNGAKVGAPYTFDTRIVLEDIDRNPISSHALSYTFPIGASAACAGFSFSPSSMTIADGSSSGAVTVGCSNVAATTVVQVIPGIVAPVALVRSNGHITFSP